MARRFLKVSEEEIVVINETAFFNACDLVNTKTLLSPSGSVKSGGYISTTIHLPFREIVLYY